MNTKYITTLEYDKLLEKVERYCKTYIGKEMLKNMEYHGMEFLEIYQHLE